MKFLIKTSAIAVSDAKCANRGEYETTDEQEIERLKKVAKQYPNDVEIVTGKKKDDKKDDKDENEPETKNDKDTKDEDKSDKKDKK